MRMGKEDKAKVIRKVVSAIKKYKPAKVILFGSFAGDDYNTASDIDLLIIKDTKERFTDRIGRVLDLVDVGVAVEPLVYTPDEIERMKLAGNPFILNALEKGLVIYEQKS